MRAPAKGTRTPSPVPIVAFGATMLVGLFVLEAVDGRPFALGRLPFVVGVWALAVGAIYLRLQADSREQDRRRMPDEGWRTQFGGEQAAPRGRLH